MWSILTPLNLLNSGGTWRDELAISMYNEWRAGRSDYMEHNFNFGIFVTFEKYWSIMACFY